MIDIQDLAFCYKGSDAPAIHDITLQIPDGSFVGVTGAAGSGKTTFTCALNGIVPHCYEGDFYGAVCVCGLDTVQTRLTEISRLVGSVCQDVDSQMVSSVVEDEMLYGLENFSVPREEIPSRVQEALADMGIEDLKDRTIASLSGGQKQKVAIASILAMRPQVFVLDEPTAELDPASSRNVFELLRRAAAKYASTVIVVEQKIALLSEFCDMLLIMEGGTVKFQGTPSDVLAYSDELLEMGINVPRSTTLVNALKAKGLYNGPAVSSVPQAVEACEGALR